MINVVCAIIYDQQGRMLVCQRPEGKALAGKWEFPGGKIEQGEQAQAALIREIDEELGVAIDVGPALTEVEWHYPDFSIRLIPFQCRIVSGKLKPIEHAQVGWFSVAEAKGLDWADADVPILQGLANTRA